MTGGVKTLLLNASFEPLTTVTVPRAISLMLDGKVDIVATGEGEMRSASMALPVPSVVKLRYYVTVPRSNGPSLSRRNVLTRDRRRCGYCLGEGTTVDHVIPRSLGGRHEWLNVVAACGGCNNRKGSRLLSDLGWELRIQPHVPKWGMWLPVDEIPAPWEPFLALS